MTQDKHVARINVIQLRIRDKKRKKKRTNRFDRLRETQFQNAKKRLLPLRIKQTIGGGLTIKRRRFGERYFRSASSSLSPILILAVSPSLIPRVVSAILRETSRRRTTAVRFVEAEVRQEMSKSAGRSTLARRSVENGSAVLRFVSRKKRTYVTHYPCCGPCSKL